MRTICLLKPKRYRSPFTSQSHCKFCVGGPSPNLGEGVELGGRVWYPLQVLRIRSNLFAGIETLSLSVNEPIGKQILVGGTVPPIWGRGRVRGRVWYQVKALRIRK